MVCLARPTQFKIPNSGNETIAQIANIHFNILPRLKQITYGILVFIKYLDTVAFSHYSCPIDSKDSVLFV